MKNQRVENIILELMDQYQEQDRYDKCRCITYELVNGCHIVRRIFGALYLSHALNGAYKLYKVRLIGYILQRNGEG